MTRSRRRQRLFRLFAMLFAIVVSLVLCEGLVRVYVWARGWTPNCYAADLDLYQPHATRGSDLKPGFRLRSGVFRQSVNALGLRGPEITREKPTGVTRIAILGGSSVFGYFVNDGEEAAQVLETNLNSKSSGVEVLNAGVPGYNLFQTHDRFRERISPLEPDIVILYLGWNDLPYICSKTPVQFRTRSLAPAYERLLGRSTLYGLVTRRLLGAPVTFAPSDARNAAPTDVGLNQFRENLAALAESVHAEGAKLVVCSQCLAAKPDASQGLRQLLSSDPEVVEHLVSLGLLLQETLARFSQEQDAVFIDAYNELAADETTLKDYVHLTVVGEQRLAELWERHLNELIAAP